MRVMNVGRQSMYDTFGDKRALFLRALETYVAESVHAISVELEKHGSAISAVRNAPLTFAARADLSSTEGCMGLNAIGEFGRRDAAEVTRIIRKAVGTQRRTLMGVFARAKAQGELGSDVDLASMADFFESALAGIRMAAKAGKSRQALRKIATFAGRAYMDQPELVHNRGQGGKDRKESASICLDLSERRTCDFILSAKNPCCCRLTPSKGHTGFCDKRRHLPRISDAALNTTREWN